MGIIQHGFGMNIRNELCHIWNHIEFSMMIILSFLLCLQKQHSHTSHAVTVTSATTFSSDSNQAESTSNTDTSIHHKYIISGTSSPMETHSVMF